VSRAFKTIATAQVIVTREDMLKHLQESRDFSTMIKELDHLYAFAREEEFVEEIKASWPLIRDRRESMGLPND
jgi:hypothetical protein